MTTSTVHTLTLPGLPPRLNELLGCHWSVVAKKKKQHRNMTALAVKIASIPSATGKRRVSLCMVLGKGRRKGDPDGVWKVLLDSLVACKILIDDSSRWCELGKVTYQRDVISETRITLEDL